MLLRLLLSDVETVVKKLAINQLIDLQLYVVRYVNANICLARGSACWTPLKYFVCSPAQRVHTVLAMPRH
jgi:hypothetical protein